MYTAFLLWDWLLYVYGPAVQLLGDELRFSATGIGLHGIALAVGTALAGVVLPAAVGTLGRRGALLAGAVLVAAGSIGLAALPTLPGTLAATVVLALGGNLAIAAAQAGLVVHHGLRAAGSVSLANGLGTLIGLFGPLLIGASVALGRGWRPVVLATVPLALVATAVWLRMPVGGAMTARRGGAGAADDPGAVPASDRPEPDQGPGTASATPRGPLPAAGWWYLLATVAGVAVENAITFWALTLVMARTGAGAGVAAATTAAFIGGMAASRLLGIGALRGRSPAVALGAAFLVCALGWLVLWLATDPVVAVLGLAVAGLGCGLLYPLAAALLLATARGSTDAAQGVIMVAVGAAIGVVPFALGLLADLVGVHTAFLLVPVLALGGLAAVRLGARGAATEPAAPPVAEPARG